MNEKPIDRYRVSYDILSNILRNGAFSSIEIDEQIKFIENPADRAFITNLCYGVLDKNISLDYIISKIVEKSPKPAIKILLKIGIYGLRWLNVPNYAINNTIVNLAKSLGKGSLSGFLNATLRRSESINLLEVKGAFVYQLSVKYSYPEWVVKLLLSQYDENFVVELLKFEQSKLTHIRYNPNKITKADFDTNIQKYLQSDDKSSKYGYYVCHSTMKMLKKGTFTAQSLSSIMVGDVVCQTLYSTIKSNSKQFLDVCAAPGGKSIYVKQFADCEVVSCDIHPHRAQLIEKFALSTGTNLKAIVNDATVLNSSWINCYDTVLCDVPCSGLGVISSKPDIMLNRKEEDIAQLQSLQKQIINVSSNYVKVGGYLVYSTCTILAQENECIVNDFLSNSPNFVVEEISFKHENEGFGSKNGDQFLHLYPHVHNMDGFFVAKLLRKS